MPFLTHEEVMPAVVSTLPEVAKFTERPVGKEEVLMIVPLDEDKKGDDSSDEEDSVMSVFIDDLATTFADASDAASLKVNVRQHLAKFVRGRIDSGDTKASAVTEGMHLIKQITEFTKTGGEL